MPRKALVLVLVISILSCLAAHANDSFSYSDPASNLIVLDQTDIIQLERELLQFDYGTFFFTVEYTFRNTVDRDVSLTFSFPVSSQPVSLFVEPSESDIDSYYRFSTTVDGESLPRELQPLSDESRTEEYDYAYVGQISFGPNQTRTVVNRYYNRGTGEAYYEYVGGDAANRSFNIQDVHVSAQHEYVLITANSWAGSIGSLQVEYALPSLGTAHVSEGSNTWAIGDAGFQAMSFRWNADGLSPRLRDDRMVYRYSVEDYVPEQNLETAFTHRYTDLRLNPATLGGTLFNFIEQSLHTPRDLCPIVRYLSELIPYPHLEELLFEYVRHQLRSVDTGQTDPSISATALYMLARFATNSVYARNGYRFTNERWAALFECYDWYEPHTRAPTFTPVERELLNTIAPILDQLAAAHEAEIADGIPILARRRIRSVGSLIHRQRRRCNLTFAFSRLGSLDEARSIRLTNAPNSGTLVVPCHAPHLATDAIRYVDPGQFVDARTRGSTTCYPRKIDLRRDILAMYVL